MFDSSKNYWLYIASHVYCCIKNKQALLYNTQTGASMEVKDGNIIALLQSLHDRNNLGAVYYEGENLTLSQYKEFVIEFCKKEMGNLVDVAHMPQKPIQMMPILNLQRDMKGEWNIGEETMLNLLELNIYLCSDCKRRCPFCSSYFLQNLCCWQSDEQQQKVLDISMLQNILLQIQYGVTGKLNLLGGNIFEYPYYKELPKICANFKGKIQIWNHYRNFISCESIIPFFYYDVVVPFPIEKKSWEYCLTLLRDAQVKYHFYIVSVEEYKEATTMIAKYKINGYSIHPIYTGTNLDFFKKYVYTKLDDIFQVRLPFYRIFAHQKLNTHFFGSLTVLSNGEVYANVNSVPIGDINNTKLLDIANKELCSNTAWRKVRDAKPCSECIYQYVCPSPSNFETVIGKPNLCHIKT